MGKRFRNKTCVYCAREGASSTGDHIFAREFFPIERRNGLPIVPACVACNNAKSALEHYLTTVLPFGGQHPDAKALLVNDVPRRLAKNHKLHRMLIDGASKFEVVEGVDRGDREAIPFDSEKLVRLMAYVARALTAHCWGVVVPAEYKVEAVLLNPYYEPHFRRLFLLKARNRVNGYVGGGAFLYEGAQAVDDPALTMWRFQVFGGLVMAGDARAPEAGAPTVWVTPARTLPAM